MKKSGQVTIFIIVGIVIISIIALFFLLRGGLVPGIGGARETEPRSFLESCIEDKIKEGIEIISLQGGYVNPSLYKAYLFEDEDSPVNISYLCYNQNDVLPCVNQEPMLIQHLKNEIHNYISDDVEDCFTKLGKSLDKQGYTVVADYEGFEVKLMEKKVVIEIDAELTLTKTGETSKQEDFKIITLSRFYDLAIVVQEIVSQEAMSCDFELVGFMLLYPKFDINKYPPTRDSSLIYTVEHKESKEEFRFAVRGCITGPGY